MTNNKTKGEYLMANQNSVVSVPPVDKVISNITMTNSELLETKSVLAIL